MQFLLVEINTHYPSKIPFQAKEAVPPGRAPKHQKTPPIHFLFSFFYFALNQTELRNMPKIALLKSKAWA